MKNNSNFYILNDKGTQGFLEEFKTTPTDGSMCIELKPYVRNRTNAQNRILHGWCEDLARHIKNMYGEDKTMLTVKHELSEKYLTPIEYKDLKTGETKTRIPHTSELGVKRYSEFLQNIERVMTVMECPTRYNQEYRYAMYGE